MARTTKHQLRCVCSRKPLLAVYGLDARGKLYVHVKVYKQDRLYGEVLVTGGTVKLHCRECLRWHTVVIRTRDNVVLQEDKEPPRVVGDNPRDAMLASTDPTA